MILTDIYYVPLFLILRYKSEKHLHWTEDREKHRKNTSCQQVFFNISMASKNTTTNFQFCQQGILDIATSQ